MMTRTIEERLDKLEANQFEIKKLLKEITSTLIVILKTIEKLPLIGDAPEDATRNEQPVNSLPAAKGTVQLPPFSGADPIGWVAHANQQFELHDVSHEVKVQAAVVAMEEAALFWVIWLRSRNLVITWEEFSQALVAHFDTRFKGSSFEHLADVKQSGLDLKVSIRSSMCLMRPSDLETAMKFSKDVEDNYSMQAGGCLFRGFNSPVQRSNSFSRPGAAASGKHGSSASNFQKPLDRPPDPRSRFTNLDNYSMQAGGCLFVMLAAVMSGFRWTMTQILLQKEAYGLKNPLTLMSYVTPIMAIATGLLSLMLDPWHEFRKSDYFNSSSHMLRSSLLMLFGGTLAFFMVLTEYILVSVTSAVTVTIAGVVKEAVTILVAVLYFHDEFTWLKGLGLLTIMAGVSLFNWYKYDKLQKGETSVDSLTNNTATSKYAILDEMDEEEDIPLNPNQ